MEWILNTLFYACLYGTVFKGVKFAIRTVIDIYQKRKATNQKSNQNSSLKTKKTKKTRKSNPMDDFITSVSLPKRRKISPEGDSKVRPAINTSSGLTGFTESNEFRTAFSSIMGSDLGEQLMGMVAGLSKSTSPSPLPPTSLPKIKAEEEDTTKSDESEDNIKEQDKDEGIKEDKDDPDTKKINDIMNLIGKID